MGPGKDTHGTLGPLRRKAVRGPNSAPEGEVTRYDASPKEDDRQVFRRARSKKCEVRFALTGKNRVFQKNYLRTGERKLLRTALVPAKAWWARQLGLSLRKGSS